MFARNKMIGRALLVGFITAFPAASTLVPAFGTAYAEQPTRDPKTHELDEVVLEATTDMLLPDGSVDGVAPGLPAITGRGATEPYIPSDVKLARPGLTAGGPMKSVFGSTGTDAIVGTDDRVEAPTDRYPYSVIGRIEAGSGNSDWSCTGTLVYRNIVLTNSHCVRDEDTGRLATWVRFAPAYQWGEAPHGYQWGVRVYTPRAYLDGDDWIDYAFLILDQNIGDRIGWMAINWFDPRWVPSGAWWTMSGYGFNWWGNPGDTSAQAYNAQPCRTRHLIHDDAIVTHDCDSGGGNSGSPVFGWFRYEDGRTLPLIVGVNFAEWRGENALQSCGAYDLGSCGNVAVQSQLLHRDLMAILDREAGQN